MPYADTLGAAAGPAFTLTHKDRAFEFAYLTQAKKGDFQKALRQKALSYLPEWKEALPFDEYVEARRDLMSSMAAGSYSFHSKTAQEAAGNPEGQMLLIDVLVREVVGEGDRAERKRVKPEDVVELLAERAEEVSAALDLAIAASLPRRAGNGGNEGAVPTA